VEVPGVGESVLSREGSTEELEEEEKLVWRGEGDWMVSDPNVDLEGVPGEAKEGERPVREELRERARS